MGIGNALVDFLDAANRQNITRGGTAEFVSAMTGTHGDCKRINTRIEIAPDGKSARITGTVKETIGLQGRSFTSTVDEVARVELIKGQPLMSEIQATLTSIR